MLIDCSYFTTGSRHILNASMGTMPNANATEVNNAIEAYIAEYQERYLRAMLGGSVGSRVNAYLVCLDEDSEQEHNDNFDTVCEQLRESFADYVFYQILRDINSQVTITGVVQLKTANSYVAPIRRQVTAWNNMVERNSQFAEWAETEPCPVSDIEVDKSMLTDINVLNL